MDQEKFQELLLQHYRCFKQLLDTWEKREPELTLNIDMQIALYCKNLIAAAKRIAPEFPEMSSHIARCFLEVEVILKWLKQDPLNYNIFCADAEYANLKLMKTKKAFVETVDASLVVEFEKRICEIAENLEKGKHSQFHDKLSPLHNIKGTAKKINESYGAHVSAYFDYYSKMSHPTAWLIMTNPNELPLIRKEAMNGIQKSIITILNTLDQQPRVI
ncbi:hypothetical protein [Pseudobdellovibrio sp. HCB154]|uniref:hypothetical protein n=1 Tax=Pseudobdellovibrio sp. HCB154 TaxID=3386277 RepID=UPI00391764E4